MKPLLRLRAPISDLRVQIFMVFCMSLACNASHSSPFAEVQTAENTTHSSGLIQHESDDAVQDAPPPMQILQRAMKAHGGMSLITGVRCGKVRYRSVGQLADTVAGTFDFEFLFEEPDKLKQTVVATTSGNSVTDVFLWKGSRGWSQTNGKNIEDLNAPPPFGNIFPLAPLQSIVTAGTLNCQLKTISPKYPNNQSLYGIRTEMNGRWIGNMYFDPSSYLFTAFEPPQPSEGESPRDTLYYDFKEYNGMLVPFTAVHRVRAKKVSEITVTEFTITDDLPDTAFSFTAAR